MRRNNIVKVGDDFSSNKDPDFKLGIRVNPVGCSFSMLALDLWKFNA